MNRFQFVAEKCPEFESKSGRIPEMSVFSHSSSYNDDAYIKAYNFKQATDRFKFARKCIKCAVEKNWTDHFVSNQLGVNLYRWKKFRSGELIPNDDDMKKLHSIFDFFLK